MLGLKAFVPTSAMVEKGNYSAQKATKTETAVPLQGRDSKPPTMNSEPHSKKNPNLDSFEAVMQAMDAELARQKRGTTVSPPNKRVLDKGKGRANATFHSEEHDIEAIMDAELQTLLEGGDGDEDQSR